MYLRLKQGGSIANQGGARGGAETVYLPFLPSVWEEMCTGCERRDGSRGGFLPIASQKGLEERRERVKPGEEESGTHVPPDCAAARGPFCDPECEVRPPARLPGRLGKRGRPRAGCDQRVGGKGIGGPSGGEAEDDGPTDARTAHSL